MKDGPNPGEPVPFWLAVGLPDRLDDYGDWQEYFNFDGLDFRREDDRAMALRKFKKGLYKFADRLEKATREKASEAGV